jgi:hypothetical protein
MSMPHAAATAGPSGPVIVLADEADLTTAGPDQILTVRDQAGTART